mgnify:CR=1 FL=1
MRRVLPNSGFTIIKAVRLEQAQWRSSFDIVKLKGFTIIELLVVVSILAILSVIGYSIFAGAQGNARDGVRRTELNNLGKNIETTKDVTGGFPLYKYTDTQFASDYPQIKPKDPAASATAPL